MRIRLYLLLFLMLLTSMGTMAAGKKFTLVIDAGHGGKDTGAPGKISVEKNINLKVALAFGKYVENNCPDVKVIYTRTTDVFVELKERANIANRNKADLFISIHTNALDGGKISRGFETYTLGMHRAADNLNVAKRENSVILIEKNYKQSYAGFDPKSSESYIMFELMQDKNMANSVELAKLIQSEVCANSGRINKGVHQAGFLVLRETSMPSCLIELGFITTSDEEQFLNTTEGQDKMAKGIYNAFLKYKRKYGNSKMSAQNDGDVNDENTDSQRDLTFIEEDSGSLMAATEYSEQRAVRTQFNTAPAPSSAPSQTATAPAPKAPTQAATAPAPKAPSQTATVPAPKAPAQTATVPAPKAPAQATTAPAPKAPTQATTTPAPKSPDKTTEPPSPPGVSKVPNPSSPPSSPPKNESTTPTTPTVPQSTIPPVDSNPAVNKTVPASPTTPPSTDQAKTPDKPSVANPNAESQNPPQKQDDEVDPAPEDMQPGGRPIFKVQIAATSQEIPTNSSVFQGVEGIEMYKENGMVKYTVGASTDFEEISNLRKSLSAKFPQAFIIAFRDGYKLNISQALKEYRNNNK